MPKLRPATMRKLLPLSLVVLLSLTSPVLSTSFAAVITPHSNEAKENPKANYDVRDDAAKSDVVDKYKDKAGKQRQEKIKEKKQKIHAAIDRLEREIPGLQVALSAHTGGPEIVSVKHGREKLSGRSGQARENVARGFLQKNADLYGLSPKEVAQLRKTADYSNPAGNLSWVEYKQEINGLPVFRGDIRFAFTSDGEVVRTTGNLVPALEDFDGDPGKLNVTAENAIAIAAESIAVKIPGGAMTVKEVSADGRTWTFSPGPFTDDVKVQLEYFPLDSGVLTIAWSMILWQEDAAYYTYVSAEGGELLWRKNIADEQVQPATYVVYDNDSPAPLSPTTATPGSGIQGTPIARSSLTRISEHASNNLGWMPDGASITTGNNVDAGLDLTSPNGIDAGTRATGTAFRVFDYPFNPGPGNPAPGESPTLANYRAGEVVSMFFWSNRYHDQLYALGFTEQARNFQQDNFGRGGLGLDRVLAEGQDSSGTDNANFFTPPDGQPGRMQMYIFTGPTPDRTSGVDQDILLHELTHGTSNRLHNNASGLNNTMSGGMGEGWSDFYARALVSGPDEDVNGIYAAGGYATLQIVAGFTDNYYYGIRRFPYAVRSNVGANGKPHNPLTFADIDPAQINLTDGAFPRGPIGSSSAFAVHNIGEVWCSALLEVRARIITRLGWATGNQLALQLVTDGMKLDPVNPTLIQGRNAILDANFASAAAFASTDPGQTELDIWRGFAVRGMGYSASAASSASGTVIEAFDVPNVVMGAATFVTDSCDNGGVADPGETVTLSIPFTNPFKLNEINDAFVTVEGTTVSLGPIAAGQTVVRSFTFTVPSTTSCGTLYRVPVEVVSGLGTITRAVTLQVGLPTGQLPEGTFTSGNVAAPILDLATVDVPIAVSSVGAVGDVKVSFRLNHTFDGDLAISLVAPDGHSVPLSTNRGSSGDNFGTGANDCSGVLTAFDDAATATIASGVAPYSGAFKPESPLSGFKGHEMNGIWKLRVRDTANLDTGTIGCAKVEFTRQLYFCCGVAGTPLMAAAPPATLVSECATAANNAPDPGEIVTISFPLKNIGSGLTTNLIATLQNGGGVTSLGGPQSYGVISPVGAPVARPFLLAIDSSAVCGGNVVATLALTDGGVSLGSVSFTIRVGATVANVYTFSNTAPIVIPATGTGASTGAPANPYPSTIPVSGVTGTVVGMSMTIRNFSHTFPSDVDLLLVGPGGQKFIPMSDLGGSDDAVNLTITLDDAAPAALPTTFISGTFRPGNSATGDVFPAPAPAAPYLSAATAGAATFASVFGGTSPNGAWRLYVVDDAGTDIGTINGGWTLSFRTADPSCSVVSAPTVTAVTATPQALWPPSHEMRDITVNYTSAGDCAQCTLSVSSNEAVDAAGSGNTAPDWEVIDAHRIRVRAERSGTGNGRIYTVTITCVNGAGTSVQTIPVYVAHDIRSPQAGSSFRINTPVDFLGRFWDVEGRSHTAKWFFDALSSTASVTEPTSSRMGSVTGNYVFTDPGVYRVSMNITDNLGNTAKVTNAGDAEAIVVIFDPSEGYVAGGGFFESTSGAMTFGFNSKYHSNAKNPKGEVQMTFGGGSMQFDANGLDYLTISGARAQVAGSGRLNGDGPYEFLVSMIDGGATGTDRIRAKIWHKVTGKVVFDSQPGASDAADPTTPVTSGSIVIQK